MNLENIISSNAVLFNPDIKSKKRALELLADTLTQDVSPVSSPDDEDDPDDLFELFTEREKLGSTGLGHGVALPHARTSMVKSPVAAFIKLDKGIDFDSPDQQATDLIFALVVPEESTDEHLKILAYLATLFSDENFCSVIRDSDNSQQIHQHLTGWHIASRAS